MPKVLVTGVNGFVGKHLVRELSARSCEVVGLAQNGPLHDENKNFVKEYVTCDLTDKAQVDSLPLENIACVINLAGLAKVGESFTNPDLYMKVNVSVLTNLCNRLIEVRKDARVIAISTGAVYETNQLLPLTEQSKTVSQDASPYALSKLAMEKAAIEYNAKGLNCIITRPFNHFGLGQGEGFLIPDLYKKLEAAKEGDEPVRVGNLATKRDYTDVRDIAKAYADLVLSESIEHDIYNVCSGKSRTGQDILDVMVQELDAENRISIEVDESLFRPSDPAELYGSYERLHEETGWEPTIPFEQTIRDFIAWASL